MGILKLDNTLPPAPIFEKNIRRAPMRPLNLKDHEIKLALKNALRYIPNNAVAFTATDIARKDHCAASPWTNTKANV